LSYEEAKRRIELARKENSTSLNLSSLKLEKVPPEIGKLLSLKGLSLSRNQLTELPPEIGNLSSLLELLLGGNQLREVPPEIGKLSSLEILFLNNNQLTEIPPEIGKLSSLGKLWLQDNRLKELPPEIGKLSNLKGLYLNSNQLMGIHLEIGKLSNLGLLTIYNNKLNTLPPEIGRLSSLLILDIQNNKLTELPPEMGKLSKLKVLNLNSNQLTVLPPEIGYLSDLHELWLDDNQLTELPPEIGKLSSLKGLWLSDNPLTFPPPAIVNQGSKAILSFLREKLKEREEHKDTRRYEGKLLILGDADEGKSCVSRALRGLDFIKGYKTTHGVDIERWTFSHPDYEDDGEKEITLNIWDFEGQEISHQSHQFFLTGRSLYVLVFNGRKGFKNDRITYWLDTIRSLAPDAKVILAATECEEKRPQVPLDRLKAEYPDLLDGDDFYFPVGCENYKEDEYIPKLQNKLMSMAKELDVVGTPWIGSYERAENLIKSKMDRGINHITRERLNEVFKESGIPDDSFDSMARIFGDMGVITHFPDRKELKEFIVLNPEWLTKAISLVMEHKELDDSRGEFDTDWLEGLWEKDKRFKGMFKKFYQCMKEFELCYPLEQYERPNLNLAPLRFSHLKPVIPWSDNTKSKERRIRFKFNINPPAGIMSRFIVKTHHMIARPDDTPKGIFWFNGVFLRTGKGTMSSEALCEFNKDDKTFTIIVRSAYPQEMIEKLSGFAVAVFSFFKGLLPERFYGCVHEDDTRCKGYHSESKIKFHLTQKRKFLCEAGYHEVDPVFLVTGQSSFSVPCYVEEKLSILFMEKMVETPVWVEKFGHGLEPVMRRLDKILGNQEIMISNQTYFIQYIRQQHRELLNELDLMLDERDFRPIPSIFILSPVDKNKWNPRRFFEQEYIFMPFCEHEGPIHRVDYTATFKSPKDWWIKAAPILRVMVKVVTFSSSVALSGIPFFLDVTGLKNEMDLMKTLVKNIPRLEGGARSDVSIEAMEDVRRELFHIDPWGRKVEDPYREARIAVSEILEKVDPVSVKARRFGDLERVKFPDSTYRWLCSKHRE